MLKGWNVRELSALQPFLTVLQNIPTFQHFNFTTIFQPSNINRTFAGYQPPFEKVCAQKLTISYVMPVTLSIKVCSMGTGNLLKIL